MSRPTYLEPPHSDNPRPDHPLSPAHPRLSRTSSALTLSQTSSPAIGNPRTPDSSRLPENVRSPGLDTRTPTAWRARTSNADLLGIGPSDGKISGGKGVSDQVDTSNIHQAEQPSERSSISVLDGFGPDERAILETRFDLMSSPELEDVLQSLKLATKFATSSSSRPDLDVSTTTLSQTTPKATRIARPNPEMASLDLGSAEVFETDKTSEDGSKSPLFPPSPTLSPSHHALHPLGILSRAVFQLRHEVEALQVENEELRSELVAARRVASSFRETDQTSIHENISEALATSLTSPSPIALVTSHPASVHQNDPAVPLSPTPTTQSVPIPHRSKSPASILSVPGPSKQRTSPKPPSVRSMTTEAQPRSAGHTSPALNGSGFPAANRGSWTSGLWVWGGKNGRPTGEKGLDKLAGRRGSGSSVSSQNPTRRRTPLIVDDVMADHPKEPEALEEEHADSSPAFKAIFLATRILTPDPSSMLASSAIPSKSLIAYLAHNLVSNAREDGVIPRELRTRGDSVTRPRAPSGASQKASSVRSVDALNPSTTTAQSGPSATYGDQAWAVGRSLLSSVSNATLKASKTMSNLSDQPARPSLLNSASFGRGFPTTSTSPTRVGGRSGSSATSPTEETPPPSVELASILPDEVRPPTVLLSRLNLGSFFQSNKLGKAKLPTASRFNTSEPPLTDRYGFIYDIQHANMLKDAKAAGAAAPASLNGTVAMPGLGLEAETWTRRDSPLIRPSPVSSRSSDRLPRTGQSSLSTSRSQSSVTTPRSKTPESLRLDIGSKSPSLTPADQSKRHRAGSSLAPLLPSPAKPTLSKDNLIVSARGASSLTPAVSAISASTSFSQLPSTAELPSPLSEPAPSASRATVSSLLDQLTQTHDRQQRERTVEWDAFLRRRAKSKGSSETKHGTRNGLEDSKWGVGIIGVNQMGASGSEEYKAFRRLVRRGIPMVYRSDVWAECSGAKDMIIPGEYAGILKTHAEEANAVSAEIVKDISRTFPSNVFFGGDGPGVAKLERVLVAYSWYNTAVGYCQGMNMLAATLLLTHADEEQAFWVLVAILDRLLPTSFFSPDLLASRADQLVLEELLVQHIPKVAHHLLELGVDLASITFGWLLSLFTDCLPVETLFRVWDVFFVEGHDVLFRVALAVIKMNEADILATETVSDLFTVVSSMTSRLWTADKLITLQHSFKPFIRHQDIQVKFERHLSQLQNPEPEA